MPSVEVDGVGRIAFPLLPMQAERLIVVAEPAPYGRGEETLVDREVRRTWQIDAGRVRIGGRHWERTLADLAAEAASGLGINEPVSAEFYKLLIYDSGSFFLDHRDTEKVPGMFATLVVVLPAAHEGGQLVVRHFGREVVLDLRPAEPSEIGFAAFYADCVHEIRPIVSGCRPTLVYNLRFGDEDRVPGPPDYRAEQGHIATMLRNWATAVEEPDKLILPLQHAYTPAELSFDTLKGPDAAVASVLVEAAADAGCDIHLALVSIEESGSAEHTGYYGRSRRWGGYEEQDEDDDEFEVIEVSDRGLILSEWRRPDGREAGFGEFPFEEEELCPPDAFEDLAPDEQHFREATGNEGASFERTYRRAGLVLWPRARRLAVLNQAGLQATLPHLEDLAVRWEADGRPAESPYWQEADALSRHMLRSWPQRSWRRDGDTDAARMLDAQVRLGNSAHIDAFLADLSAEGCFAASDCTAIARAATLLAPARATELLARIVTHNARAHLGACGDLLRRCVMAPDGPVGDPARIGAALIEALPGDPAKPVEVDVWRRPAAVTSGLVVDLLTALSRIDADAAGTSLALQAIDHMLAWPVTYPADGVLVPALLVFAKQTESRAWPAVLRLRETCLDHLRRRIAEPLEAPRNWARANPLECPCAECASLGAFLVDAGREQWHLKAAQDRRSHVEGGARSAGCDLSFSTEKRGRPYTLISTKTQATYERRAKQRRQDLEHVSALGG